MAEKRRVLIVDDEFRIGILIKKLTHWDELEMECQDILDNGEAAFETIKKSRPDIVITDVRMPKVSGLDLIKMVREEGILTQFIVISGYKEFEYARQAIAYGVESYILKPVNETDLNDALKKICQKLSERDHRECMQVEMQKKVDESNRIIKRDFLKNIMEEKEADLPSNETICLEGEGFLGIDIKLDCTDLDRMDAKQEKLLTKKVCDLADELLAGEAKELMICEKEAMHIYGLLNYDEEQKKNIQKKMGALLLKIKEYLMGFELYEVTIGIGNTRHSLREARFSILEAYHAVCSRIYLGTGRLICADESSSSYRNAVLLRLEEKKENVKESIEQCSKDELSACISDIFMEPAIQEKETCFYYDAAEDFLDYFFQEMNNEDLSNMKKKLKIQYQHCFKVSQLTRLLRKSLGECVEALRQLEENKSSKPVRLAKQYVEEHYGEKILLEDVAAVVELNPVYFSVVFKEETDMNFSAYLIQVRMEKAKKMLTSSNETIAAIGDAVGYSDPKYFSQLFKKSVGVKPTIYRRLYS